MLALTAGCKEKEFEPEGPTDVRVENLSDLTFSEVIVKIKEEADTLGNISAGGKSDYFRFETAFSLAEISARINGELYSTGPVNYTGMHYMGLMKITYQVYISNVSTRELKISQVIPDEPLVLK